ncbi:NUDIX domain-containing protein [Patescibacteria group bacterium]|nr:NUDIX domain-containing protein [Patescibacteria group bacterium]
MHRYNCGKEYYVLPGGGVEDSETPEQAAIREAKEETGLEVVLSERLIDYVDPRDGNPHIYFFVSFFSGKIALGGEEAVINNPEDFYELEWHPLDELEAITFYPEEIIDRIVQH